jgi:hypothetical protein
MDRNDRRSGGPESCKQELKREWWQKANVAMVR